MLWNLKLACGSSNDDGGERFMAAVGPNDPRLGALAGMPWKDREGLIMGITSRMVWAYLCM